MSDNVGQAVLEEERQQWLGDGSRLHPKDYSEATAREVDLAIRGMIDEAYASAKALLRSRLDDLKASASLLLARETITPDDFPPLLRREGTGTFPKVPATSNQAANGQVDAWRSDRLAAGELANATRPNIAMRI